MKGKRPARPRGVLAPTTPFHLQSFLPVESAQPLQIHRLALVLQHYRVQGRD
jgi:hypothetical protein